MIKSLLTGGLGGLLVLVVVLVVRTVHLSQRSAPLKEMKPGDFNVIPLTASRLKHFQQALQFETVSTSPHNYNRDQLQKFGDFLISSFPLLHARAEWERVNNYSFLYHIKGSNRDLRPYLLMSHLDVVPATNLDKWEAPPFSGKILDGFIYGRGAIDVKQCVMGILEATEYLLASGVQPVRSFFIAFGHDEEVHGYDGARALSKRLEEKGVKELEFISDEGLPLSEGIIPGLSRPVASIGVSEKGQVLLKLSTSADPGHSSLPPKETTIGILARAVHRLESNPHPSMLGHGIETETMERLVPEMPILQRIVTSNIWLFKPAVSWFMSRNPTTDSMIRTVTAVTMFNAGIKVNVIPPLAEAMVNHRIHPSQTVQQVIDYDRAIIADHRVKIEVISEMEPHPTAAHGKQDFGYQMLSMSIRQVWPSATVVPGIMVGNTDTIHYLKFTCNVYRFSPTYMFPGDPLRFHGNNERISVSNYERVINFFYRLIRNSDLAAVPPGHPEHQDL